MTASPTLIDNAPQDPYSTIILAHGAGAAMDSPFMNDIAQGLFQAGHRVIRFEFPYMARKRQDGRRRPPDRQPVLVETFRDVIVGAENGRLVIGGKSMGGRIASMIADEVGAAGVVCLGYPFHPPGKPDNLRIDHLQTIQTKTLILQGTRDPFGTPPEVTDYGLSKNVQVVWLEDGDHSLKPRARSGRTEQENRQAAVEEINRFVRGLV